MKLLFDTSVLIDYLRRKDKEQSLYYQLSDHEKCIALLTHTELYAGKSASKKDAKEKLEKLLSQIIIFPFTLESSFLAGQLKATYHNLELVDATIAATAIHYDIPLVTLNTKDFETIKGLKLFQE